MSEFVNKKKDWRNWPTGSLERALGGKSALEALSDKLKQNNRPMELPLEKLDDEQLALALAGQIVRGMHKLGVRAK